MTATDVALRWGYHLSDLDQLTRTAVNAARSRAADYHDRHATARTAIAEALYAATTPPTRRDLVAAGATAIDRAVQDDLRHKGYRWHNANSGAGSAPRFAVYWWDLSTPTPSPEPAVVERIAVAQVLAMLTDRQREALIALAATDDHSAAAASLGLPMGTYSTRLGAARRAARQWWHQGETPARPTQTDRRRRRERAA